MLNASLTARAQTAAQSRSGASQDMCRNRAFTATVAAAVLAAVASWSGPVFAWPFGGGAAKPATPAASPAPSSTASAKVQKASPEQRAAAARLDPLARAAFWNHEFEIDPTDAVAGVNTAAAMRALGRNEEAADVAGRVLVFQPKNVDALMEVARANIAANRGFYAIAPLRQAAALNPTDWKPWTLLGVAYEQSERHEEALSAHIRALTLAPNSPAALSNMALFRATHGAPGEAEALLRKAVAQPDASAKERQNLALVLGMEGKMGEAERLIREDLPPEQADANLAYLKSLSGTTAPAASTRSWDAVKVSEARPPS